MHERRAELISFLKSGTWISSGYLAKRMKFSRQALHKQIESLRSKGYEIQAKPKLGYKLISKPDLLLPGEIASGLHTKRLGQKVFHFHTIDSTQNKAKQLAEEGESEGTLVIAETQSAGRGRLGRGWHSQKGGIWFSLILRPQIAPQCIPQLALVFSLAAAKAIEEECGIQSGVKWPNDVLISPQSIVHSPQSGRKSNSHSFASYKKVCGILTEMSAESERVNWVVLGFGINANNSLPEELRSQAISLIDVVGQKINRVKLMQTLLKEIETIYENFLINGFARLRKDYLRKLVLSGKKIAVSDFAKIISGKFSDIAEDGSLILLTDRQEKLKLFSGDVTIQK